MATNQLAKGEECKMKRVGFLALGLAVTLSLSACGKKEEKPAEETATMETQAPAPVEQAAPPAAAPAEVGGQPAGMAPSEEAQEAAPAGTPAPEAAPGAAQPGTGQPH